MPNRRGVGIGNLLLFWQGVALGIAIEFLKGMIGANHHNRWGIEGNDGGGEPEPLRLVLELLYKETMPPMYPIKNSNGGYNLLGKKLRGFAR